AGWSTGTSDFPWNFETYTTGGTPNGVVVKFDQEGELKWSNLYGGNYPSHFSDVAFDNNGHVLVVGFSGATNLQTEPSDNDDAYFQNQLGGSSVVLAEFPTTGDDLIWATYFGGSASDKAFT